MTTETQELWSKRVERWKDSGLTAAEYAQETGLNRHTLTYWKWRLNAEADRRERKQDARAQKAAAARFIEVTIPPVPPPRAPEAAELLELVFEGGLRLRIPTQFDETALRRVVATLGGR